MYLLHQYNRLCNQFYSSKSFRACVIQNGCYPWTKAFYESQPSTHLANLNSVLVLCNSFRRFILNFARFASPLNQRLKKTDPNTFVLLSRKKLQIMDTLKHTPISPPVLTLHILVDRWHSAQLLSMNKSAAYFFKSSQTTRKYPSVLITFDYRYLATRRALYHTWSATHETSIDGHFNPPQPQSPLHQDLRNLRQHFPLRLCRKPHPLHCVHNLNRQLHYCML